MVFEGVALFLGLSRLYGSHQGCMDHIMDFKAVGVGFFFQGVVGLL